MSYIRSKIDGSALYRGKEPQTQLARVLVFNLSAASALISLVTWVV